MPVYDRGESEGLAVVDAFEDGVGWLAHPDETGRRVSHAFRDVDGDVWLVDPLDAPDVESVYGDLGPVAGVIVLSAYHTRDADVFARRHGVSVHVPSFVDRVAERVADRIEDPLDDRVEAPVERFDDAVADFTVRHLRPLHAWDEALAYRERDGTLYVADFLTSHPKFTVDTERVGMPTLSRLSPPVDRFAGIDPERLCFGHGAGVHEDAAAALEDSLTGARRRFPRAVVSNLPAEARAMFGALH